MPASYVRWLECAGARTIAIPMDATPEYLDDMFTQIHMVFLPGGDMPYPVEMLNYLLDKVCEHNQKGHYFPVWGTCLGLQQIMEYVSGRGVEKILTWDFQTKGICWPLQEVMPYQLYKDPEIYKIVTSTPTAFHSNRGGISPEAFRANPKLDELFHITSINYDRKGKPYVTTIETKFPETFPFYAVQYHPEKNSTEYGFVPEMPHVPFQAIDHSPTGVYFSLSMAQFVVSLARKSVEANAGIHQYKKHNLYPPMYTYPIESKAPKVLQIYVIPKLADNHNASSSSSSKKQRRMEENDTEMRRAVVSSVPIIHPETATPVSVSAN